MSENYRRLLEEAAGALDSVARRLCAGCLWEAPLVGGDSHLIPSGGGLAVCEASVQRRVSEAIKKALGDPQPQEASA